MLWRALLAAVAISYLICVLFLSGIQKEDLDVSLLKKLQRHNVDLDDFTNDKLRKECLNNSDKKSKEEIEDDKVHNRARLITTENSSIKNYSLGKLDTTELETVLIYLKNRKRSQNPSSSEHNDNKDTRNNKNTENENFFDITMRSNNATDQHKSKSSMETHIKFWKTNTNLLGSNPGTDINSVEVTTQTSYDVSNSSEYNDDQVRKLLAEYLTKRLKLIDQITKATTATEIVTKKVLPTTTKTPLPRKKEPTKRINISTTPKIEQTVVTSQRTTSTKQEYIPNTTSPSKEGYIPQTQQHLAKGVVILTRQSLEGISDSLQNGGLHSAKYTKNSHNILTYNIKKPNDHVQTTKNSEEELKNNQSNIENLHAEINYEYEKEKQPATVMLNVHNNYDNLKPSAHQNAPRSQNPNAADNYQLRGYHYGNLNKNNNQQQEFDGHVVSIQNGDYNMQHQLQDTLKPISTENRNPVIRIQREPDRYNQQVQYINDRPYPLNLQPQYAPLQNVMDQLPHKLDDNSNSRGYQDKNLPPETKQISHFQELQVTNENRDLESDKHILQGQNSDISHSQYTAHSGNAGDRIGDHHLNTMNSREASEYRDRNMAPEFVQRIVSGPNNLQYRNEVNRLQVGQYNAQVSNNDQRHFQHNVPLEAIQQPNQNPTKSEYNTDHTTDHDKLLSPELIQQIAENVKQLVLKDLKKELISSTSTILPSTTTVTPSTTARKPTTTKRTTTTKTTTTTTTTWAPTTTKAAPTTRSSPSTTKPTVVTALPVGLDLNNVQVATKAIEKIIELFEKFKVVRDKNQDNRQTFTKISNQLPSKPEYQLPIAMMPVPLQAVSSYKEKSISANPPPYVEQQYIPQPLPNAEIAPSFIPHTFETIDPMTGMNQHPKEMPHMSEALMIQTNVNDIRPLAIQMKKPEALNVNIVLTTENPYWKMRERERWNFMLQYNKPPDKGTGIKNVNNIKTTYTNDRIFNSSTTPGKPFVNTEEMNAIKNREKWLNSTIAAFDKSLQLSLMKELGKYNRKPEEFLKYTKNKANQYSDLSQNKYNQPEGTSYNDNLKIYNNFKNQPTEKYFTPPISKSDSTNLLNLNLNNLNISRPEESYANLIVKKFETKLDETVNTLNAIAKLKNLYKMPDKTPSLSDYDRIKIENPIIVTDLNALYKYRGPESAGYDSGSNGNIFGHPGIIKDFGIDKTDRKISINQISDINALLNRNIDNPVPYIQVNPDHNNVINLPLTKGEPYFNIPYPSSPLIDNMKPKEKYSDIPLFSHDVQNQNPYLGNQNQPYGKYQYFGNKFNNRDDTIKDNFNKYDSQIEAIISNLSNREKAIKNLQNSVPKYKANYDSNNYNPTNKMDNVRLKFENRDKFYHSLESSMKKPSLGRPHMTSRYKNKMKESEMYHHGDDEPWYRNKEGRNEKGNHGPLFATASGKGPRPRPTSSVVGVERPNHSYHEFKQGSETDRKQDLQKKYMDMKEYTNTHDKLEDMPMTASDCGNDEHCILKVASRLQIPITKIKTGKYDDRNFKDFLKTQQKVNQMLENILAAKLEKQSVETL